MKDLTELQNFFLILMNESNHINSLPELNEETAFALKSGDSVENIMNNLKALAKIQKEG